MSSSNCYSSLYPFPFDLNEDDQHQHHHLFTFKSQPSSSSSSSTVHHLAAGSCQREPQEFQDQAKIYVSKDGALENSDCGLKLSLWKKEERVESDHHHEDTSTKWMPSKLRILRKMMSSHHTDLSKSSSPKIEDQKLQNQPSPSPDNSCNSSYNNDINNSPIRVCADCNTTKTPLWRSGPRGPKSLCNACGIRQRKARRAMAAAAAATASNGTIVATETTTSMKNKVQNKAKRSSNGCVAKLKNKKCKLSSQSQGRNKLCFEDLRIILSKSSAFHGVFPQDEKEAAILLMALSYGLVHG
ncbi:GATA transcription factor 4-like [Gossypium australe]|uniref:GATA transcription factor 4-like n=1 Tax=Gossypium australe TaxID=47621 RepID=A0A5B6W6W6_9ROSI|nr:GATA transcription factor 4-like [Gossypium australe]